jgi:intracellular septation protein A
MNKSRLIWGIICLVLAAVLGVLSVALPPDSLMFYAGDQNMRWVPAVVLGIVGIVLLATAGSSGQATAEAKQPAAVQNPEKAALNKRLENIGWGLFLIMLGGFALVPAQTIPKGIWSIGVGVIMLGLNAARYFNGIRMSGFTTFLGVISLVSGILELFGNVQIEGAIFLIILGAYLLVKPWFDKRRLFGKAEDS